MARFDERKPGNELLSLSACSGRTWVYEFIRNNCFYTLLDACFRIKSTSSLPHYAISSSTTWLAEVIGRPTAIRSAAMPRGPAWKHLVTNSKAVKCPPRTKLGCKEIYQ